MRNISTWSVSSLSAPRHGCQAPESRGWMARHSQAQSYDQSRSRWFSAVSTPYPLCPAGFACSICRSHVLHTMVDGRLLRSFYGHTQPVLRPAPASPGFFHVSSVNLPARAAFTCGLSNVMFAHSAIFVDHSGVSRHRLDLKQKWLLRSMQALPTTTNDLLSSTPFESLAPKLSSAHSFSDVELSASMFLYCIYRPSIR